jgi:hypothetical protein
MRIAEPRVRYFGHPGFAIDLGTGQETLLAVYAVSCRILVAARGTITREA